MTHRRDEHGARRCGSGSFVSPVSASTHLQQGHRRGINMMISGVEVCLQARCSFGLPGREIPTAEEPAGYVDQALDNADLLREKGPRDEHDANSISAG